MRRPNKQIRIRKAALDQILRDQVRLNLFEQPFKLDTVPEDLGDVGTRWVPESVPKYLARNRIWEAVQIRKEI